MANPWDVPITPVGQPVSGPAPAPAPSGTAALLLALKRAIAGSQELPAQPALGTSGNPIADEALALAQKRQQINQAFAGGTGNPMPR